MSDEYLHCWQWTRERASDAGYWSHYPAIAEQYEWHEVTIVFWEDPERGDSDD